MATLDDIIGIGSGLFNIGSGLFGSRTPRGTNELLGIAREQNQLAGESIRARNRAAKTAEILNAMILNPRAPLYKRMLAEEEGAGRRDLVSAVDMIRRQNTRGKPILSRERGDESISNTLTRGFADLKGQARNNVRKYLSDAVQRQLAAAGGYSGQPFNPAPYSQAVGFNAAEQERRMSAIGSGLGAIYQTLRPRTQTAAVDQTPAGRYMWGDRY